jgi:hypothetical protein
MKIADLIKCAKEIAITDVYVKTLRKRLAEDAKNYTDTLTEEFLGRKYRI